MKVSQPFLPLESAVTKDQPKDFEEYMNWLTELEQKDHDLYEKEFDKNYFKQK